MPRFAQTPVSQQLCWRRPRGAGRRRGHRRPWFTQHVKGGRRDRRDLKLKGCPPKMEALVCQRTASRVTWGRYGWPALPVAEVSGGAAPPRRQGAPRAGAAGGGRGRGRGRASPRRGRGNSGADLREKSHRSVLCGAGGGALNPELVRVGPATAFGTVSL